MVDLVPAVDRALRILSAFENGQAEYGVSELSRTLGLNKSTVHNILNTLCHHNLLQQNRTTLKYRLGPRLVQLGYLARQGLDLRETARPFLTELMHTTGETAFLSVFESGGITIIDKAEPLGEMKITASIGQRVPVCAGCLGRAFLAWLDEAATDRILVSPGLRRFTNTSITDPAAFKARLALVRQRGYDVDETEEYLEGVWAVSAPIRDADGLVAALTVVGFTSRMAPAEKKATVHAAVRSARHISQLLGAHDREES
ncbi:MAG: IclR family transcriptional regulator [Ardenticatenaceae bacterium]|nr:IclR family transcriptional regulator [Ardenticatenaceae bacterium]HBY92670.1 IclR family transcriptional regulator [Chloroflexota bacterium]